MSGLFASGCQSIGASAFVFPMNVQGWFPLGLTGLNPLLSKKLSKVFFSTTIWKHQFFGVQPSLWQKWSLWPVKSLSQVRLFVTHGLKHARLPCPSPTPGTCSNSCLSSWWCQSNNFILCHPLLFQGLFPLGLTDLISLLSRGLSRVFSRTSLKASVLLCSDSSWSNSHIHTWLLDKP